MKGPNRLALLFALAITGVVHAAPFQNGSFENGSGAPASLTTLGPGDTSITGWTVTGNGIDWIGTYWVAANGTYSLDLSAGTAGGIEQTFDTVAGHDYSVTFALAGNGAGGSTVKMVQVQATGGTQVTYSFDTTGTSYGAMGWTTQTYTFTATGPSTTLSFTSLENSAYGPALDNVAVTDVTPVPTPALSAWALLGLAGLLGLIAWSLRREQA
jgi:choice-of-anchor C domain-containing protein